MRLAGQPRNQSWDSPIQALLSGGERRRRVGFIALAGVAAQTGVVMLIYLDYAYTETVRQRREEGQPILGPNLHASIIEGAVEPSSACGRECSGQSDADVRTGPPHCQKLTGTDRS